MAPDRSRRYRPWAELCGICALLACVSRQAGLSGRPPTFCSFRGRGYAARPSASGTSAAQLHRRGGRWPCLRRAGPDGVLLVTGSGRVPWGRSQVVFDVMDTVVRDPFTDVAPRFFGMSLDELFQAKNSSAWFEFERGNIDEAELRRTYFCDGRDFDLAGLKAAMLEGYEFVEGMPELLADLRSVGHQLHAFSNYPEWYTLIEDKLGIESSHGVRWTSVSCDTGLRKPESFAYQHLLRSVGIGRKVGAAPLLFVDNDARNCEAAREAGITSVHFTGAGELRGRLGDYLGSRKRGTVPEGGWPPRKHSSADEISD